MFTTTEIITSAQNLLSQRVGGTQKLSDVEELEGSGSSWVFRAKVASSPFFPHRSVIIKYLPETGDPQDDASLVREVVAYQFTNTLPEDVRPGPILLAHDLGQRLLVISDSGEGDTFDTLLTESDPDIRATILRNLGQALGRMHAGTAGRENDFDILFHRMLKAHHGTATIQEERDQALSESLVIGEDLISRAGIQVPPAVRSAAQNAQKRLSSGRYRAFTPFDLSPDNIIVAERTHFLDYEWAGFRDVAFDVACVIAGFPQYVGTQPLSDDEADLVIEAWTHEVRSVWSDVHNEDRLHSRLITALVGWSLASVSLLCFESLSNAAVGDYEHPTHDLLRDKKDGPFSSEDLVLRRDLCATFAFLARFAKRGSNRGTHVAMLEIAEFARTVSARLCDREPGEAPGEARDEATADQGSEDSHPVAGG